MPAVLRRHARAADTRVPLWRKILSIADGATERLATLWRDLFLNVRLRLRTGPLRDTLEAPNILEAQMHIAQAWEQAVEVPARRRLAVLGTDIVEAAGKAAVPHMQATTGQAAQFTTGLAETEQYIQQYIGTQIRDITQTSLTTVRRVLQDGWRTGTHPRVLARQLRDVVGLTPRQASAIARQQAKLTAQGRSAREVAKAGETLSKEALRQRALTISRTESLRFANAGAYRTTLESVRRGYVREDQVRRLWIFTQDQKCCEGCAAIPEMNEEGVGLYDEFNTPFGPVLLPPAHPNCRCGTTVRILP
jgi:hypothetical protein